MLNGVEKILVAMEIFAIIGVISFVGGIGFGIYKLITWLI